VMDIEDSPEAMPSTLGKGWALMSLGNSLFLHLFRTHAFFFLPIP